MASPSAEISQEPQVVFRPGKKRKIYRHRAEDTEANDDDSAPATRGDVPMASTASDTVHNAGPTEEEEEEGGLSVAEALRRRLARKPKLGGVAFRAERGRSEDSEADDGFNNTNNAEQSLMPLDGGSIQSADSRSGGVVTRFAPQTGLVGELVNKHMEEYIESELAKRKQQQLLAAESAAHQQNQQRQKLSLLPSSAETHLGLSLDPKAIASRQGAPQPATRGKLHEIDLGEEARARNIATTERAMRRLRGQAGADEEDGDAADAERAKKARLGPDGKPWRPKTRRGSDDIKRDELVEEFLRENRLDVYDIQPSQQAAEDEAGAADDRLAEQFRREFLESMQQRYRRRPAINAPPRPKEKQVPRDDILRGPKLGGSRNTRQAMRDKLLQEQEIKRRR